MAWGKLIYSDTYQEHLQHLCRVLEVLQEKKQFAWHSVSFLGFTVGRGSVDKESSKVEEVRNWPIPERPYRKCRLS